MIEGVQRFRSDDLRDPMFGEALRAWGQTDEAHSDPSAMTAKLLPLCDVTTNLFHTDMAASDPRGYRLTQVTDSFGLWERQRQRWTFGEYPDRRFLDRIILPAYTGLTAEGQPIFERISTNIQGRFVVFERLILPFRTASFSLSRQLLRVEDASIAQSPPLSLRERQCLALLASGKAAKAIAGELGLAQKTIEHCIERLKHKLGACNVAQAVAKAMLASSDANLRKQQSRAALSPRERQCLGLLASGRSWRQAASELGLSPKTVEKHVEALKAKLGARNAAELVALGIVRTMR